MAEFGQDEKKDSTAAAAAALEASGSRSSCSASELSLPLNFVDFRTEEGPFSMRTFYSCMLLLVHVNRGFGENVFV